MADTSEPDIVALSHASAICLACGYCCSGELFFYVPLPPEEVLGARNCGLDVRESPTIIGFPLPCSQYRDQRCAVYDDAGRPRGCRTYQCWLLYRYLQGRVTAKHARRMVRLANRFHARVVMPPTPRERYERATPLRSARVDTASPCLDRPRAPVRGGRVEGRRGGVQEGPSVSVPFG